MTEFARVEYWNTRKLPTFGRLTEMFKPKEETRYCDLELRHEVVVYEARPATGDIRDTDWR